MYQPTTEPAFRPCIKRYLKGYINHGT
jgi:hypothetical protein